MSRLTRCTRNQKSDSPLPLRRVAPILVLTGAALTFVMSQLYIQFAVSDMDQQTRRLQKRKMELKSENNLLRAAVESGRRGERLLSYARDELGMVEYSLDDVETIELSEDLVQLYESRRAAGEGPPARGGVSGDRLRLAEVLASRLGLTNLAFGRIDEPSGRALPISQSLVESSPPASSRREKGER